MKEQAFNAAKKVSFALAVAGLLVAFAANNAGASMSAVLSHTVANRNSSSTKVLKVALVAPSATNDLSWTETMYSALERLKNSQHLQIAVSANEFVTSDAANIIRQYATEGYNLVIAHGSQYGSTIQQLAPQFPKVSFAWGTAGSTFGLKNVFAYEANANEGGYVEGYVAAKMSKSHVLGVIGPFATGDDKLFIDGYVRGAKAADPSVTVHPVYTGSYSDDSLYATAAKTFVGDRADILAATTQASVGAIGVAKSDHLPWFGNDWSMVSIAPQNVVATEVYNWTGILEQMFTEIRSGKLGGATYVIGLGNGGERIEFNPSYTIAGRPFTPTVKAEAEHLISEITDGTLTVPQ